MATFLATQGMRVQHHFEVLEIDLPVITGACTIGSAQGTGTPLSCDQPWSDEYKTYYFTNENAPILPSINGEPIWRCIKSINETATELKPGDGLSSRSSLSIVFNDFDKQDPNVTAPGVTDTVKNQGTYFGKLDIRQIFENKNVRLKLYRVESDGSIDLANGAQTRNYLAESFSLNKDGSWSLACKDVLSLVNLGEKSWPITQGGFLRLDIDAAVVAIPVDEFVDYSDVFAVRVGDEFMEVTSVTGNLTASATLNVTVRGSSISAPVSTVLLTDTVANTHSSRDEVFICKLSDNQTIDSLLTEILVDSDFPVALIPSVDWAAEVLEWHSGDKINTLHSESEDVNDVINRILTGYLMDLWFSVTDNEAKLSAISVWKQSTAILTEGKEVNAHSIKKTAKESLRATRALVLYDKRNLADSDDTASYKKGSQFADNTLISADLYTKHKDKLFNNNFLLTKDAAVLLTQWYVSRFKFTPFERSFITDERYLTFKTGDVVDLQTSMDQSIYGLPSGNIRSQITRINPDYKNGRQYKVKAITYEAAFTQGSEIVLDTPAGSINLHILAGAPSTDVDFTFILAGGYSHGSTAIRAGNFTSGSTLVIIMVDGFDGQADGGNGGDSDSLAVFGGHDGGTVYDANGVTTDIYFAGATPSVAYPVANGFIRAPGGGGAAGSFATADATKELFIGGGGGGGAGRVPGIGGASELDPVDGWTIVGVDGAGEGVNGDIVGNGGAGGLIGTGRDGASGGDWGEPGLNTIKFTTTYFGGAAGSGIVDGGGTVTLHGDNSSRYINGNGDHP